MATFGLPEAIHAIQFVIDVAVKIQAASGAIKSIEQDIRQVKNHLEELNTRMDNPNHPLGQASPKMKSMIEVNCKDIRDGCAKAAEYFEERQRMPWWEWGSRYTWISYRIPALQEIMRNFRKSTTSIHNTIDLLISDAQAKAEAQKKASDAKTEKRNAEYQKKLEEKLDKLSAQLAAQQKSRKSDAVNAAKLGELLKSLKKKELQEAASGKGEGKKIADGIVEELIKNGMTTTNAKKKLEATLSVVRSEKKIQTPEIKRAATDEAKKGATAAKPVAGAQKPTAATPTAQVASNHTWILCVDNYNSQLSLMAQYYLEILRAWTMNTQKNWIFERVNSAGVLIPTEFSKSTLEADKLKPAKIGATVKTEAIATIAGPESYFQTKDPPDEKGTIVKRVQSHHSQGLTETHFQSYDHIICFGGRTHKMLRKLREMAAASAAPKKIKGKIFHIKETDWYSIAEGSSNEPKDMLLKVTGQLKAAIKTFLKTELKWEMPPPGLAITAGEWRTALMGCTKEQRDNLRKDDGALKKKILNKKGCLVFTSRETESTWLMAIAGPKGKLAGAQKMALT